MGPQAAISAAQEEGGASGEEERQEEEEVFDEGVPAVLAGPFFSTPTKICDGLITCGFSSVTYSPNTNINHVT